MFSPRGPHTRFLAGVFVSAFGCSSDETDAPIDGSVGAGGSAGTSGGSAGAGTTGGSAGANGAVGGTGSGGSADGASGSSSTGGNPDSGVSGAGGDADGGSALRDCEEADFGGTVALAAIGDVCTGVSWRFEREAGGGSFLEAVTCAPPSAMEITADDARALLTPMYPFADAPEGLPEVHLFVRDPVDFGGVAAVSTATGALVVELHTEFLSGSATPVVPRGARWRTPAACRSSEPLAHSRGLQVVLAFVAIDVPPLATNEVAESLARVSNTSLLDELGSRSSLRHALVVRDRNAGELVIAETEPLTE